MQKWEELYELEELLPLVVELAEKYTGGESTSVTYEKAQQLMGAVIYCIRENYNWRVGEWMSEQKEIFTETQIAGRRRLSAREAYETGYRCVIDKVKAALALYHEILEELDDFGNEFLKNTIRKGMPEFFTWYNPEFEPQDTILMLDYEVQRDLSMYEGIDRIYEYLKCVREEQKTFREF